MECLALSPLKFTVWSSDSQLIRTNVFVNAHPKATVARMLQYIHSQIYAESRAINHSLEYAATESEQNHYGITLGHVSEYCLYYKSKELALSDYLQDVEPNHGKGFVRLRLEKRKTKSGSGINLDYDLDEEFTKTNLQINVNALSVDKIMSVMEQDVSMGITMARLKKLALQLLCEYESRESSKNLCSLRDSHTASDFIGFIIKGKQEPIYLNDENSVELYDDLTLAEFLGLDFVPQKANYFTVMFKVKHGQDNPDGEDCVTVDFISDATLSVNHMTVTPDTTVEQVKDFICSAYTHSLSLSSNDIKLIYKGQLVHRLDFAGNPSKVMEYINESEGAKMHVYINQEFNEPGPGFWSELFNNPDRFDFMRSRTTVSSHFMLPSSSSQSQAHSLFVPQPDMQASLQEISPKYEFVTESGVPVERSNEVYVKCSIPGEKDVYISANHLDPVDIRLEIEGSIITLSSLDYSVDNGLIRFSPNLVLRLESLLNTKITKHSYLIQESNVSEMGGLNDNSIQQQQQRQASNQISYFANLLPMILLIFRTFYFIANNSVIPFFFVLELSTLLPWKYTTLIAIIFLVRTIWSTREIWDLWSNYLNLNVIDETAYMEIKQYIREGSLTLEFYKDCENSPAVIDILMASNVRELRGTIYETYHIEHVNEENGVSALKTLLRKIVSMEIPKESMDDFLISCLNLSETSRETIPYSYLESLKELLLLARRDMERSAAPHPLPWYRSMFRTAKNQVERFRQSQVTIIVLEHVVPDPRQDNLAVAIIKNLALFFLILLPPVKDKVDTILEERQRNNERIATQETQRNDELHAERNSELLPVPDAIPDYHGRFTDETNHENLNNRNGDQPA